jgi:hypothetical protein
VWDYVGRNRAEVARMREYAERVEHELNARWADAEGWYEFSPAGLKVWVRARPRAGTRS